MNKGICMLFTFVGGIVVGAAAAYKVAETKYRNIAEEEIASVVDRFSNRKPLEMQEETEEQEAAEDKITSAKPIKNTISNYKSEVERTGYDKISSEVTKPKSGRKKAPEPIVEQPEEFEDEDIYIISPDEFNTLDNYDSDTYYYSADHQVLDSMCHLLEDFEVRATIGHDPYGHFGEYDDQSVHIRNERLMMDYEILLSMKTAEEIMEG